MSLKCLLLLTGYYADGLVISISVEIPHMCTMLCSRVQKIIPVMWLSATKFSTHAQKIIIILFNHVYVVL